MKEPTYPFRREDNGEVVQVDFCTMIGRDAMGYVTLPDGVEAKYIRHCVPPKRTKKPTHTRKALKGPRYSESLGFTAAALPEMEEDRVKHGLTDIAFEPDPDEPSFMRVRGTTQAAIDRYSRHRGCINRSGHKSGAVLSPASLENARKFVQQHGRLPDDAQLRNS